jgi:pyridoxine 5-phosphate synthase
MAVTPEMFKIALKLKPASVCLVPEKRQELTTEGGLDLPLKYSFLLKQIPRLQKAGISVFPFVDPDIKQITLCKKLGCDGIELHTGEYAQNTSFAELERLKHAAQVAHAMGLEVHAGHGLDYNNIKALLKISEITEFNIGHSIVARAVFVGLNRAVREMRTLIN